MKKFELKDKNFFIILAIVVILVLILLVVGIKSMYKLIVFDKIYKNADSVASIENYTMVVKSKGDIENTTTLYYKNGVGRLVDQNGNYTWTDGAVIYVVDNVKKTVVKSNLDEKYKAVISKDSLVNMIPGYTSGLSGRIATELSLSTKVKTKRVYDQKYYVITSNNGEQQKTLWINKANLMPSQATVTVGDTTFTNNYEISFSNVKNEDIALGNFEGYSVTYNGEKVDEGNEVPTNTVEE